DAVQQTPPPAASHIEAGRRGGVDRLTARGRAAGYTGSRRGPMKNAILKLLVFLSLVSLTHAQEESELDRLMTRRTLRCEDVLYNSSFLVQKYFEDGKYDSVKIILDYWEQKCGLNEPLLRMRILSSIYEDRFSEDLYEESVVFFLLRYEGSASAKSKRVPNPYLSYLYFWGYNNYGLIHPTFNEFTRKLARINLKKVQEGDVRYLLCKFYDHEFDFVFDELKSDRYNHTRLKRYYENEVEKTLSEADGHLGFIGGAWFPQGNTETLGVHPTVGFSLGFKKNRILYDFTLIFRFLDSSNRYTVEHKGSIIETKKFLGGYIGLDLGYETYRDRRNEIDFVIGAGLDGFTAYSNRHDKEDTKDINSFNFNVGLGYRYYFSDFTTKYIGFQVRMNFVDYHNPGGTNLSGNTVSLRITLSWSGNEFKYSRLRGLRYDF
ncbi:MAG: hypothetical protein JSU72_17430, partial [Deltaproteobacteria bacterium]